MNSESSIDELDARLIALLDAEPRIGVLECSRRLGVARGTVQARLDKLVARGVVRSFGPQVDPAALGYPVMAFVTLELRQAVGHDAVAKRLALIPEVLEAHTVTGTGDLLCRIVARTNAELQGSSTGCCPARGAAGRDGGRAGRADPAPHAPAGPRGRRRPIGPCRRPRRGR
ncbi:hypothetical protein GCM10029992_28470 [Glycomyces albus]